MPVDPEDARSLTSSLQVSATSIINHQDYDDFRRQPGKYSIRGLMLRRVVVGGGALHQRERWSDEI